MRQIDPNIVCKVCGDWHCITEYDPSCYPVHREAGIGDAGQQTISLVRPEEQPPDLVQVSGCFYVRVSRASIN